jgi:hypothetical protein
MRARSLVLDLVLALAASAARPALAAGFAGNGCDTLAPELGAAWFLGDGTVHACIDVAPGFGVGRAEIADAFAWASGKWAEYVAAKKVNDTRPVDLWTSPDFEAHPVATRFVLQPACDGREDLRLEAGTTSPASQAALQRLSRPLAFALPTSSDYHAGWTKGLIWLAAAGTLIPADETYHGHPYWTHAPNLRIALLHELGHVFGTGHVAGTIMDPELEGILRYPAVPPSAQRAELDREYARIDRRVELVLCQSCTLTYALAPHAADVLDDPFGYWADVIGRPVREPLQVEVTAHGDPTSGEDFTIVFRDAQGALTMRARQAGMLGDKMGDDEVFKRAFFFQDRLVTAIAQHTDAATWIGELALPSGRKLPIVIGRNMNGAALSFGTLVMDGPFAGPRWLFEGRSRY